jgi:hypothetical protein
MPSTAWGKVWPLRFRWPRHPRGLDPLSPRLGRYTAFAGAGRRPFRIWRFASPFAEASPIRLALAAGQVRLAFHPGVSQSEWSDLKPAGSHFYVPAASASPGIVFTFPSRGRSALRGAEAPRSYRRARRSGAFASVQNGPPRTFQGGYPSSGANRTPLSALAGFGGAGDSLRFSRRATLPVPDLRSALPFGFAVRALSRRFSRPSSIRGVDCPNSPTSRSELHPVRANCG